MHERLLKIKRDLNKSLKKHKKIKLINRNQDITSRFITDDFQSFFQLFLITSGDLLDEEVEMD
jgi:hypothetical protein